jgi:hypothetical protein
MLTFLASVAFLQINKALNQASGNEKMNAEGLFVVMKNLKCKVYDNKVLVKEPTKKMKATASKLAVKFPETITLST